jgi:proline racemase
METRRAVDWEPPSHWMRLTTIESHTGGEPFRVVIDGLPDIPGGTVLERRRYAQTHLDGLRRALMWEPRGHSDMYGGWIGPPTTPGSDLSVLFTHNEGFSTMCGHGIIALAKVVLETGIIPVDDPEARLSIDTPAGLVSSTSTVEDGVVTSTTFRNVASFVADLDAVAHVPGQGDVVYDLAFGGAFYAFVDADAVGVALDDVDRLVALAGQIKSVASGSAALTHPDDPDLGFLYGVIFTGPASTTEAHSRHVCVFADGEVDRSPTGTGVSARLAILHRRGALGPGEVIRVESIVGSTFTGRIAGLTRIGDVEAVIPEVRGSAHITGRNEIWIDPDDVIGEGFLIR